MPRALLQCSDRMMLLSVLQIEEEPAAARLTTVPHPAGRVVRCIGPTLRRDWCPIPVQRELLGLLREAARAVEGAAARSSRPRARKVRGDMPSGLGGHCS